MDATLVNEIAEQVVRQQILANWLFWFILVCVLATGSFFGNLVASYASKRGETLATRAAFDEILRQLKVTTKATEEIRSAVSLGEWSKKEQLTLRRIKLEELLSAACEIFHGWLDQERRHRMFGEELGPPASPMPRFRSIAMLYFSELRKPVRAFEKACDDYSIFLFEINVELLKIKIETARDESAAQSKRLRYLESKNEELRAHNARCYQRLLDLETEAASLMERIVAVE